MSFRPPTMSEDFSVDLVVKYNRDLTDQINNLIEPGDEQIKQILANICHNMVRFAGYQGLNNPLETMKLGVWSSFFTPIKTLMNVPHPQRNFVTARMVLYLGSLIHQTFDDQVYPHKNKAKGEDNALSNFCINLDDALLKPLKNIWKDSKNSEDFKWAFAGDDIVLEPCHTVISAHELEVALALSPSERSRLSEKHGERFYYQEDAMAEPKLFKDPMPRWDCGQYNADLLWTSDGSDGPIRLEFWYDKSEDHDTVWDKHIPLFRRSKQFCLDARQICEDELGKQVRIQLNEIMKQHKVPREPMDLFHVQKAFVVRAAGTCQGGHR
ncbi:hypothetical protein FPOAC1_012321 [Fusarium poae]|uniref:hypothetical protein n=1 Tax=Fusarium poae TaxID=36050 RepID=UPI001CEB4447|nr:hypothetical protein FPOAC1_012321 [Fusarium poae]KAG8667489.1 hypothetical protein FPOAC1_012321 [Fusarium poae]